MLNMCVMQNKTVVFGGKCVIICFIITVKGIEVTYSNVHI